MGTPRERSADCPPAPDATGNHQPGSPDRSGGDRGSVAVTTTGQESHGQQAMQRPHRGSYPGSQSHGSIEYPRRTSQHQHRITGDHLGNSVWKSYRTGVGYNQRQILPQCVSRECVSRECVRHSGASRPRWGMAALWSSSCHWDSPSLMVDSHTRRPATRWASSSNAPAAWRTVSRSQARYASTTRSAAIWMAGSLPDTPSRSTS